jgi:hypothetical protein
VIDVVTVINRQRRIEMITTTEETATAQTTAAGDQPKPTKKANVAKRARHAAPAKAKSGKKASPAKKAPKAARAGKAGKEKGAREGSKTATVLELLKHKGGVSSKELQSATGWQPHSLRGFLSGTVSKKIGLTVTSVKTEEGERRYSVNA